MKKIFLMTLMTIAAATGAQADSRQDYIDALRREMGAPISDTAVNAEASVAPDLSEWCNKASVLLRRELGRAQAFVRGGNMTVAHRVLDDALLVVSQSMRTSSPMGGPLTKILADRGVVISAVLSQVVSGNDTLSAVSKLNFLFEYVEFMIQMEAELDRPYYIPYRYIHGMCRRYCQGFDFQAFQALYLGYATRQLRFTLDSLAKSMWANGEYQVVPMGDPRILLNTAQLVSGWVAGDVANNLFAFAHSCTINKLLHLSSSLRAFNQGDKTIYPTLRTAVSRSYREMTEAANALDRNPNVCW